MGAEERGEEERHGGRGEGGKKISCHEFPSILNSSIRHYSSVEKLWSVTSIA